MKRLKTIKHQAKAILINYEIAPTLREYWFDNEDKAEKEIEELLNI